MQTHEERARSRVGGSDEAQKVREQKVTSALSLGGQLLVLVLLAMLALVAPRHVELWERFVPAEPAVGGKGPFPAQALATAPIIPERQCTSPPQSPAGDERAAFGSPDHATDSPRE